MPSIKPAAPPDRRTQIADAAIEILARDGAHGLTHRALDRQLALAEGSTSYYFRRRLDLMIAAAERVAESVLADLDWVDDARPITPDQAVDSLTATLLSWMSPARRTRTLALLDLLLLAHREPAVGAVIDQIWRRVTERNRALYRALGAGDALADMEPFRALLVGLMMRAALGGEAGPPPDDISDLLRDTARFLATRARRA